MPAQRAWWRCYARPAPPQRPYRGVLFSSSVNDVLKASRMRLTRVSAASCGLEVWPRQRKQRVSHVGGGEEWIGASMGGAG